MTCRASKVRSHRLGAVVLIAAAGLLAGCANGTQDGAAVSAVSAEPTHRAPNEDATPTPWPTGIFQDNEAPASTDEFVATNRWVGAAADGQSIAVYAGVSGTDPTAGRILVLKEGTPTSSTWIEMPGSGALRVESADGTVVTLVDPAGKEHVFDAATLHAINE